MRSALGCRATVTVAGWAQVTKQRGVQRPHVPTSLPTVDDSEAVAEVGNQCRDQVQILHHGRGTVAVVATATVTATVVAVNMLGNGVSFSPGDGGYPDLVSIDDNARLQKKLVDDVFDGRQLSLAYGYSMGGMQALAFARLFPDAAARVMCVCGAAGCEAYNAVFLEALLAVLAGGGSREEKLRTFATVYAGWGVGYDFYRDEVWRDGGFESLEDFVERSYVGGFARDDPEDLRAMVRTWHAAPPAPPGLENIKARVLLAPCDTDAYFRVPEVEALAQRIPGAVVRPLASPYGHRAGDPQRPGMESEREWLRGAVSQFREGG